MARFAFLASVLHVDRPCLDPGCDGLREIALLRPIPEHGDLATRHAIVRWPYHVGDQADLESSLQLANSWIFVHRVSVTAYKTVAEAAS